MEASHTRNNFISLSLSLLLVAVNQLALGTVVVFTLAMANCKKKSMEAEKSPNSSSMKIII